jgi:hypothetical protein
LALFGHDAVSNLGPQCAQEQTLSRAKPETGQYPLVMPGFAPRIHVFFRDFAAPDLGRLSSLARKNREKYLRFLPPQITGLFHPSRSERGDVGRRY